MTRGDWFVVGGDGLVLLGLLATMVVYLLQLRTQEQRDKDSVLAALRALRDGIRPWGEMYFEKASDDASAMTRAQQDFDLVTGGQYGQVFRVPTEPLTAFLQRPEAGWLVRRETIEAVNVALWQVGVFNQLVKKQTDFNVRYADGLMDARLPTRRRHVLANAAKSISYMLHKNGIGDAQWYRALTSEIEANIVSLTPGS